MTLKLTVVDQSPVQLGTAGPAEAPALSARLAQQCDRLGYHRYWLAEHHNSNSFAGPCPEVLISHIASITERIRVGSGGVMLPNHNPYKVAEQFRMLATLFAGRIDLGIGRAPGGDGLASAALAYPYRPNHGEYYSEQAELLCQMLRNELPASHPFQGLRVMPDDEPRPELWMLGTSGGSATLAGQLGMAMSLGLFITPDNQTVAIMEAYQRAYRQAGFEGLPRTMVTVSALCAESDEQARFLAASQARWKVMAFRHGIREPWLSPEAAWDHRQRMGPSDAAYFDALIDSVVWGSPESCERQLHQLADYWQTDEIGLVTVTHDFDSRRTSYRLLAERLLGAPQQD
ncbi:LLM class flavin-dependent oxidoreductase [Marinobacterium arenosum]|uniref:LLM class flavin-dependent oxidoreductase n=1 Tax=Marinobacterium arenosum TaxID=2862496 RepID=UPI001C974140|nr:LLM class flavin-dependent oxidoreductase [Marinobacterium arenosum]MBY4676976.1 LLM class flavin-dependent oxidoreductase [Marinobacterium arenosum]